MPDLTEFLLARITEDEQAARYAQQPATRSVLLRDPVSAHVARWDPARVLAECEAKRRIIEHHLAWEQTLHRQGSDDYTESEETMYRMAMQWVIRQLVQPYADHPDFDPSWRVE